MPVAHHGPVELHYETFGSSADPTLLLVNGLGGQSINYADDWCRDRKSTRLNSSH